MAQGMVNLGLCAYYQLNKKMIADKLCINKNKPELHCNGKCYLSKQFKKAEENEKRQSQTLNQKDEVSIVDPHRKAITFTPALRFFSLLGIYLASEIHISYAVIEQPPQFLG